MDDRLSAEVHQAAGMVSVQADCTTIEALDRLKIRAAAEGCTLDEMAQMVLDRTVRFD